MPSFILQQAATLPITTPHSPLPTPTPTQNLSNNSSSSSSSFLGPGPHYQNSTISSHARQHPSTSSHYRPAVNNQHHMVTRARTNSLKPKDLFSSLSSSLTIEPSTFKQAVKSPCWQEAMKNEFDALMRNRT